MKLPVVVSIPARYGENETRSEFSRVMKFIRYTLSSTSCFKIYRKTVLYTLKMLKKWEYSVTCVSFVFVCYFEGLHPCFLRVPRHHTSHICSDNVASVFSTRIYSTLCET